MNGPFDWDAAWSGFWRTTLAVLGVFAAIAALMGDLCLITFALGEGNEPRGVLWRIFLLTIGLVLLALGFGVAGAIVNAKAGY